MSEMKSKPVGERAGTETISQLILRYAKEHSGKIIGKEIVEIYAARALTPGHAGSTVYTALGNMVAQGKIVKVRAGLYFVEQERMAGIRISLDDLYMELAELVSRRSTCIRRKTGAVASSAHGRCLGWGYNGQPRGWTPHCIDFRCPGAEDPPGNTSRCESVHSEVNLCLNCSDLRAVETIYLTTSPCHACALMLANLASLERIVYRDLYVDTRGIEALKRSGIRVEQWKGGA